MPERRSTRKTRTEKAKAEGGLPPVCPVGFCPIGLALAATEQVRPEVVEHLLAAGRELLLAMRALIDARAMGLERTPPLERIEVG